jgi:hypothetical protein
MVDLVEVKLGNAFCGQTGANLIMDELETDSFWHVDCRTVVLSTLMYSESNALFEV